MQGSKLLPAIEGGFLLTNDFDLHARACALGHYGRIPADHDWHGLNSTGLGYKYRIHPVATALARIRLRKLDQQNRHIASRVAKVTSRIEKLPGIHPFRVPPHMKRVHYQFEVIYDENETGVPKSKVIEALEAEGARVTDERYPLQHRQEVYARAEFWLVPPPASAPLPVSEKLQEAILQLPNFAACEERIVDEYIAAFEKVWAHLQPA
jgi:dTDP-4-amino-4,6-dideoxygalactose transaminase